MQSALQKQNKDWWPGCWDMNYSSTPLITTFTMAKSTTKSTTYSTTNIMLLLSLNPVTISKKQNKDPWSWYPQSWHPRSWHPRSWHHRSWKSSVLVSLVLASSVLTSSVLASSVLASLTYYSSIPLMTTFIMAKSTTKSTTPPLTLYYYCPWTSDHLQKNRIKIRGDFLFSAFFGIFRHFSALFGTQIR